MGLSIPGAAFLQLLVVSLVNAQTISTSGPVPPLQVRIIKINNDLLVLMYIYGIAVDSINYNGHTTAGSHVFRYGI